MEQKERGPKHACYLLWELDVMIADHDGYCSGAENDEQVTRDWLWCRYAIPYDEMLQLQQLQSENVENDVELFNACDSLKPLIQNDDTGVTGGTSFYCSESAHGLRHERQRTPVKVVRFSLQPPPALEACEAYSALPLIAYLQHIRCINACVAQCLPLPKDVIKLVCRRVWTK